MLVHISYVVALMRYRITVKCAIALHVSHPYASLALDKRACYETVDKWTVKGVTSGVLPLSMLQCAQHTFEVEKSLLKAVTKRETMETLRWTIDDLELLPDDGSRYEIIDGELYVSKQPDWQHQLVCFQLASLLQAWSEQAQVGLVNLAPGIVFTDDTNVVLDVVWISHERLRTALQADGKLHAFPELVIEVLSPGSENERRDREIKLSLYSRRNAQEYWVVNWRKRNLEVYRRANAVNAVLTLDKTLHENDVLVSPLLPGFRCKVGQFFKNLELG